MAHPYHHALSSVRKWGGKVEDYLPIHNWFDASKSLHGDFRHRVLRHHTFGIFEAEKEFGLTIVNADGQVIPVRWIGEQHVVEDCGHLVTFQDWVTHITPQPWMNRSQPLSRILDKLEKAEDKE